MSDAFDVFLAPDAFAINRARLDHLASLGLALAGKRVLEVGAGIGLLSHPFEELGCTLLSTDGSPRNILEMRRRFPHRDCAVLDIDSPCDLTALGTFDAVFCYGTLYHLANPDRALQQLAAVCTGQIMLETIVMAGEANDLQLVRDPLAANQAIAGVGCRPTRPWVMDALRRHFGHAYTTVAQPDFPDYVTDWGLIEHAGNLRAVFVGSRVALRNSKLTETPPRRHAGWSAAERPAPEVRVDVASRDRAAGMAWAHGDDSIVVHAFEPQPRQAAALAEMAPANYVVHAKAVALANGTASAGEAAETVQTTRLDSFLHEIDAARVEILRIGAQPGDLDALCSLGDRLADVRRIQLETGPAQPAPEAGRSLRAEVVEWLSGRGFMQVSEAPTNGADACLSFENQDWPEDGRPQEAPAERLYDFANASIERGEAQPDDGALRVETGPEPWSYAVVVPPQAEFDLGGRRAKLKVRADVAAGQAQIGILDSKGARFVACQTVSPHEGGGAFSLDLPHNQQLGALVIRNAGAEGVARLTVRLLGISVAAAAPSEQPAPGAAFYDERTDFETIPPGWEDPFGKLRQKWSEIPASYQERRDSASLLALSDADLLAYWEQSTAAQTQGDGYSVRGWFHDLYRDVVKGKRILDVGCGIGTSSISFAEMGAELTFVDIAEGNVRLVERICALKGITARFGYIEDYASYDALPQDFDIVMAIGSLINAPHGVTKREIDRLKRCLKPGGRWLHLAYPRARWEREGRTPFAKWGEMTDGPGTPWMVYQDRAELEALFAPSKIRFNFDCEWRSSEFNWFDIELLEL